MTDLPSDKTTKGSKRFASLLYLVKRYKKILTVVLVLSVVAGALENLTLGLLHIFLQYFFKNTASTASIPLGKYFDPILEYLPWRDTVISSGVLILVVLLVKNLFIQANSALVGRVVGGTVYDLKKMIMDKYSRSSYQSFLDTKYGESSYCVLVAPLMTSKLMLIIPNIGAEIIKITMIIAFLMFFNWKANIVCIVLLILFMTFIKYLSKNVSLVTGKGRLNAREENVNQFNEFFTGIKYLDIYRQKQHWLDIFNNSSRTFSRLYEKDIFWMALPKQLLDFLFFGGVIASLITVYSLVEGSIMRIIPEMGVYIFAMMKIIPSASNIGRLHMNMANLLSDAEVVSKALNENADLEKDGDIVLEEFHSDIKFDQVRFSHRRREVILDNMNLTFERGKITAIVGESGSGKSTILNLLLRLFRPKEGKITIDGQPLNSIKIDSWLKQVGFVGQDTFIFHSSIFENITFNKEYNRDEVIEAAKIAGIHNFIINQPEGYETIVGERGMKLSGGQQQRIAIARAILGNPDVLILDEATSSLDSVTEESVQKSIDKTLQGRTVIMVAHRFSTIEHADKIVVLKQGRIVEEGTHERLLAQQGEYYNLYRMQNRSGLSYESASSLNDEEKTFVQEDKLEVNKSNTT